MLSDGACRPLHFSETSAAGARRCLSARKNGCWAAAKNIRPSRFLLLLKAIGLRVSYIVSTLTPLDRRHSFTKPITVTVFLRKENPDQAPSKVLPRSPERPFLEKGLTFNSFRSFRTCDHCFGAIRRSLLWLIRRMSWDNDPMKHLVSLYD